MPTGQSIVNSALTKLGIRGQGETPGISDSQDALDELNRAWAMYGVDEGLIFAEQPLTIPLAVNQRSYNIGLSNAPPLNVAPPSRIYRAFIVNGNTRTEIRVVNADAYFSHHDFTASSGTPDELYPDFNVSSGGANGSVTLYLYPQPTGTPNLEMTVGATFSLWTLAGNYNVPQGFEDFLGWALAFRLLSSYGAAVAPEIAQSVMMNGSKAEARIREMNSINRKLPPQAVVSPEAQVTAAAPKQ